MVISAILSGIIGLILLVLTILIPVFICGIYKRANEQMKWNEAQLEAQNRIIQELYQIRIK